VPRGSFTSYSNQPSPARIHFDAVALMSARRESAPAVIESPCVSARPTTQHDVLESRGEPLGVAICDLPAPTLTLKTNSDFCGWVTRIRTAWPLG
jgi:hypothetical protein